MSDMYKVLKEMGHVVAFYEESTFDVRTTGAAQLNGILLFDLVISQPGKEEEKHRKSGPYIDLALWYWFQRQGIDAFEALHSLDWQAREPHGVVPFS